MANKKSTKSTESTENDKSDTAAIEVAAQRRADTGRNDTCPCGSGKKYKKCHLRADEEATLIPEPEPDAKAVALAGWRLFEQRRPGAAEKQFRAALELDKDLADAQVGIAMARLSVGDNDTAKGAFAEVIAGQSDVHQELLKAGAKDGFDQPKAQPFIRASHALGCLYYDEDNFEGCTKTLAGVYEIDAGAVGTEARLVAAKSFIKLKKPAEAVAVLEPARDFVVAAPRANMGLALAHFMAGDRGKADKALSAALEGNPHLARAVLGQVRQQVGNAAAATPGSREEAAVYAQGFGDVWDDDAKAFLSEASENPRPSASPEGGAQASEPESASAT